MKKSDIINGLKYLKEVPSKVENNGRKRKMAMYECFCGNKFSARIDQVKSGNTKSCGCVRVQKVKDAIWVNYNVNDFINGTKYLGGDFMFKKTRNAYFECKYCKNKFISSVSAIKSGHTKSCGCFKTKSLKERGFKHGMVNSDEYNIWAHIKSRCLDINNTSYDNYGGRGIKICERWMNFINFYKDMGNRPSVKHSIDRINVNGNYEPNNCRWATIKEQNRNTRRTIYVYFEGKKTPLVALIEKSGLNDKTVRNRHQKGVPIEELFNPISRNKSIY